MTRCKRLLIFEGPDGGGKTQLARLAAKALGARYVHLGPFPRVTTGLARLYLEAMLPALMGYQHVVMDRSWLSEAPYGQAFRGGQNRLDGGSWAMLLRAAMRCELSVVLCLPPWETCRANFLARKGEEYLTHVDQLQRVYQAYAQMLEGPAEAPMFDPAWALAHYDYTRGDTLAVALNAGRTTPHDADLPSAGNLRAPFVLVGEKFGEVKDHDALYQLPFTSFDRSGCSQWLTEQLAQGGIGEAELLWVNADVGPEAIRTLVKSYTRALVVALGEAAATVVAATGLHQQLPLAQVPHPQHAKRFRFDQQYELITEIRRYQ